MTDIGEHEHDDADEVGTRPMEPFDDPLNRARATRLFENGPFANVLAWLPGLRSPEHGSRATGDRRRVDRVGTARGGMPRPRQLAQRRLHGICGRRLTAIALNFVAAGMVREAERPRFDALVDSTRRRCQSGWAAVAIVACTYALLVALLEFIPRKEIPYWHHLDTPRSLSAAGWWHLIVSAPLLLALSLAWLWRLLVWTHFLWRIARLPIRLCAAHPDRAGGLKFVGYSVRAFGPVGAALGALLAGRIANEVWHVDAKLDSFAPTVGTLVAAVLLLFGTPLLTFSFRLMQEWREGLANYGRLAEQLGFQFEDKWFGGKQRVDPRALEVSDFSAAVDLSTYVATVYDLRLAPGDLKSFVALAAATAIPLLPVVLIAAPFDVLMKGVAGLLF